METFKGDQITECPLGLYEVFWKEGGSSFAAIGQTREGGRWMAPTNWLQTTILTVDTLEKIDKIVRFNTSMLEPVDTTEKEASAKRVYPILEGGTYIIGGNTASNHMNVWKVVVLETTETTVHLGYPDTDGRVRITWDDFNHSYKVVEELEPPFCMEELLEKLRSTNPILTNSKIEEDNKNAYIVEEGDVVLDLSNGEKNLIIIGEGFESEEDLQNQICGIVNSLYGDRYLEKETADDPPEDIETRRPVIRVIGIDGKENKEFTKVLGPAILDVLTSRGL